VKSFASSSFETKKDYKMVAKVGDKLPGDVKMKYIAADGAMKDITVEELCKGKKVVMFCIPGAFTPTCSMKQAPSYVAKYDEIMAKGVDTIACVAVNDAFVMQWFGKHFGGEGKILMLGDGNGDLAAALGTTHDMKAMGFNLRSRRYAMYIEDQVVKAFNLEEGGAYTFSGADDMLKVL
jgi:peroxiredoxin